MGGGRHIAEGRRAPDEPLPQSPSSSSLDGFGRNFERGRNLTDLGWYGDPELWGQSGAIDIVIPAGGLPGVQTFTSEQLVRVQVPQLLARVWRGTASYEATNVPATLTLNALLFDFVIGVGHSSQKLSVAALPVQATGQPLIVAGVIGLNGTMTGGNAPLVVETDAVGSVIRGAVVLPDLCAASIACTARALVSAQNNPNPIRVTMRVGASVAPRAP